MDPPPRSFAADAYDCIMVRVSTDPPNTRLWRAIPRPQQSSPQIVRDTGDGANADGASANVT